MKIPGLKIVKKLARRLKNKKALIVILAIALGLFILTRGSPDTKQIKTQKVERSNISQEIIASGQITTQNQSSPHFATAGKLVWLKVNEGDYVKKGQAIALLDKERYQIAIRQAEQDVLVADAQLAQVYDDISKATGAESFQNRIKRTAAEAKKNIAFDNLKKAQRDARDATLISPISGIVTKVEVNVTEEIFPTTEIVSIKNTDIQEFIAQVDETDVVNLEIGQDATITLDSLPNNQIDSHVKSIATESVTTTTGATAYEVKIEIPASPNTKLGMNGEAKVEIESRQNVLTIPAGATVDDKYVWVKTNHTFEKREIETGLASETDIEVISGLQEDQELVTSGFDQIGKKSNLQKIIDILK